MEKIDYFYFDKVIHISIMGHVSSKPWNFFSHQEKSTPIRLRKPKVKTKRTTEHITVMSSTKQSTSQPIYLIDFDNLDDLSLFRSSSYIRAIIPSNHHRR